MYNKSDSRIIIIGGSGLIGSSLNNVLLKDGFKVISTYTKMPFQIWLNLILLKTG